MAADQHELHKSLSKEEQQVELILEEQADMVQIAILPSLYLPNGDRMDAIVEEQRKELVFPKNDGESSMGNQF